MVKYAEPTTMITLEKHFEERFRALEKSAEQSRVALEKRLDGMNEIRETMKDQASKFITRDEYCAQHKPLEKDIQELREYRAKLDGKASQSQLMWVMAISIIGLLVSVIGLIK